MYTYGLAYLYAQHLLLICRIFHNTDTGYYKLIEKQENTVKMYCLQPFSKKTCKYSKTISYIINHWHQLQHDAV